MESKIKEIVDEQKNMIKQVLSQQQKATLNNLEKMEEKLEGKLENYHEEVIFKQQELKKLSFHGELFSKAYQTSSSHL